jgi:hypothetical protein
MGWVGRYFLRRLALARKDLTKSYSGAYSSALFEVMLVVVLAPCMAIFSCILITSLRWAPAFGHEHPGFSPKIGVDVPYDLAGSD